MRSLDRDVATIPLALVVLGTVARLFYWQLYPPIYKIHAVFTPLDSSAFAYVADFQSYMAVRMPFYDVLAAAFYVPLAGVLGIKALSAFTVFVSIASLPLFYLAVRRLFDASVATYALALYALYPKFIVLAGQGFPEAASVACLVGSLYAVTRGRPDRRVGWLAVAGVFALLSYLTFLPGVAVGVLFAVWLYVDWVDLDATGWRRFVPDTGFVAFSLPPGVVGVLYLRYGPLTQSVGVVSGVDRLLTARPTLSVLSARIGVSARTLMTAVFVLCFVVLLVNGAVEGSMVAENHSLSKEQPVAELAGIVGDDETVAVATRWDYYDVVIYSESSIRPTLVAATPRDATIFRSWTVLAPVERVDPADLSERHADYFYAAHCGDWRPRQQQYLTALNQSGGEIVHEETIDRGPGQCTVRVTVVDLPAR